MDNELLVKTIRSLCKENNISISQLESDLKFGAGLISRWTKSSPSLDKIIDIADYFQVTLDEVVGRNQKNTDNNYEFVNLIIEQTKNKELYWKDYFSQTCGKYECNIPEEENIILKDYSVYPQHQQKINKFYTKCDNGYLMLSSYLITINNTIDRYEFFFYLQPFDKEKGIIQKCNQEQLFDLYKIIDAYLNGNDSEIISNEFKKIYMKKHFINNYQRSLDKVLDTKNQMDELENDPYIMYYLAQLDLPEVRQMIEMYTDPKMAQAVNNTQRIIQYLNKIKSIKNIKQETKFEEDE